MRAKWQKKGYLYCSFLLNIQNTIHHKLCDLPASCIIIIRDKNKWKFIPFVWFKLVGWITGYKTAICLLNLTLFFISWSKYPFRPQKQTLRLHWELKILPTLSVPRIWIVWLFSQGLPRFHFTFYLKIINGWLKYLWKLNMEH